MSEETIATETTAAQTQVTETPQTTTTTEQGAQTTTQPQPTDDLLTRVSKFELNSDPNKESKDDTGGVFHSKELEDSIAAIEDPALKTKMENMRKSLETGAQSKFQEIATLRKEMQSFMEGKKQVWTPQAVQNLANDKQFIEAAQQIAGKIYTYMFLASSHCITPMLGNLQMR